MGTTLHFLEAELPLKHEERLYEGRRSFLGSMDLTDAELAMRVAPH